MHIFLNNFPPKWSLWNVLKSKKIVPHRSFRFLKKWPWDGHGRSIFDRPVNLLLWGLKVGRIVNFAVCEELSFTFLWNWNNTQTNRHSWELIIGLIWACNNFWCHDFCFFVQKRLKYGFSKWKLAYFWAWFSSSGHILTIFSWIY